METFSYQETSWDIREDLQKAHRYAWQALSEAGTWWTGEERVAIAAEVRHAQTCSLCKQRKEALSPNAVQGEHQHLGKLTDAAIDVIHRVVTDPGRLTEAWFRKMLEAGLSEGQYVEIVGVITMVMPIDTIHLALGLPMEALPSPQPGEPSQYRPPKLKDMGAWVPLSPSATVPRTNHKKKLSLGGNVILSLSLVPDEAYLLFTQAETHYLSEPEILDLTGQSRAISRPQIELLAARVSAINECFY